MIAALLQPYHRLAGKRCQGGCGKTLCAGQSVLIHRLGSLPADMQWFGAHVDCIRDVLADAPEDAEVKRSRTEREFHAVRDRLMAGEPLFEEILV